LRRNSYLTPREEARGLAALYRLLSRIAALAAIVCAGMALDALYRALTLEPVAIGPFPLISVFYYVLSALMIAGIRAAAIILPVVAVILTAIAWLFFRAARRLTSSYKA
jgi:hypothetical protein